MVGCAALQRRLDLTLEVVTVDHGLRPEATNETAFVIDAARSLGLTAHLDQLQLPKGPAGPERARVARYQALERVCSARQFELIATAHTASDQAETLLMRLGRGASLSGAAAIREQRGRLIRPMLNLTRKDVIAYLEAQGRKWVEDPTNRDGAYLRTQVREKLLPLYEELMGPGVTERLAHFSRVAEEDDEALRALSGPPGGADDRLHRDQLSQLGKAMRRRVVRGWLERAGLPVDGPLLDDVLLALEEGRRATLPNDKLLELKEGYLTVVAAPPRSNGQVS
jgi:tRNA(Ile)-lysidine synthase